MMTAPEAWAWVLSSVALGNESLKLYGHEGASAYFFSHLGISQQENLVVFASFSGAGGRIVYKDFLQNFYARFFADNNTVDTIQTSRQALQEYRGNYLPWRGSFSKAEALLRVLNGKDCWDCFLRRRRFSSL